MLSQASAHLLFSKSRATPSKGITIPRLELSAAVLGAKAAQNIKGQIHFNGPEVYWTDSTIVLGYIRNMQRRYHTYVCNRVEYIHSVTEPDMWRHVPSNQNPADLVSRGVSNLDQYWFEGPDFLKCPTLCPALVPTVEDPSDPEIKQYTHVAVSDNSSLSELIARMFSYDKLHRVVAYVLKFIKICKKHTTLNALEYFQEADQIILQNAQ